MSEQELARWQELCHRATPGPWEAISQEEKLWYVAFAPVQAPDGTWGRGDTTWMNRPTAEFIAMVRNLLPDLLDAIAERDGIIHDMMQDDGAFHRGRESTFGEVLAMLRAARGEATRLAEEDSLSGVKLGRVQQAETTIESTLHLAGLNNGEKPPALPPDAVRLENARLRRALERIAKLPHLIGAHGSTPVPDAQRLARLALGETS